MGYDEVSYLNGQRSGMAVGETIANFVLIIQSSTLSMINPGMRIKISILIIMWTGYRTPENQKYPAMKIKPLVTASTLHY